MQRRPYFGRRLKELRESYVSRIAGASVADPLVRAPSIQALVQCLREHGMPMSAAAYNEIEQGYNVPRKAPEFLEGVAGCLKLTESDAEDLKLRLAYDILWARLGELANGIIEEHSAWEAPPPNW